jgi:selT/selW/selH-like putative selenoprotein
MTGVELRPGDKGTFEVTLDGETVFSKKQQKRFPRQDELAALLEERLGPPLHWRAPG